MSDSSEWVEGIPGNFPLHKAVVGGKKPVHYDPWIENVIDAHLTSHAQRNESRIG